MDMMFDLSYSVKGEDEPFKMKFEEAFRPEHSSEPIPSLALAPQWLLAVIELAYLL